MDVDLTGRLCLVTGAGHGIGKHVAALLTNLGGTVYGCDITFDDFGAPLDGKDLEVSLADESSVDITDQAATKAWVARAEAAHSGPVFILVNCAGGVGGNPSRGAHLSRFGVYFGLFSPKIDYSEQVRRAGRLWRT